MDTLEDRAKSRNWDGFWLDLIVSIIIPVFILTKFSGPESLGATRGLVVALMFPLGLGWYELIKGRGINWLAVLGLIGVGLTGGIGLFELDNKRLAIKEAAVPLVIGLVVLGSSKTKRPLVETLLNKVIDKDLITSKLIEKESLKQYKKRILVATYIIGASFLLSATLNYFLARFIVVSDPGSAEFNVELGKLMALSYPVIALPSMIVMWVAIWWLLKGVKNMTGYSLLTILGIEDK